MKYKLPTKKIFDYVETNIVTPNGLVPSIFGQEICSSKKQPIEYTKSCFAIHFVLSGKGYVNKTLVTEDQVFVFYPNSHVSYVPDNDDPWTYIWVEFDGLLVSNYLDHCGFSRENYILKLESLDKVLKVFNKIFLDVPKHLNKHARNILYESYTMDIFSQIIEECGYLSKNKEKSSQLINVENIINFINNNYSNPKLNVAYIAQEFSYVPSYLTRLFKKYSNMPPCKYITKIRMEKAVELLTKGDMNINQISNIVGYQSQFYFSKAFLEYYGVRPSLYLEQMEKN